jgi:hypothetical protein
MVNFSCCSIYREFNVIVDGLSNRAMDSLLVGLLEIIESQESKKDVVLARQIFTLCFVSCVLSCSVLGLVLYVVVMTILVWKFL